MNIEIHKPELEVLIHERMKSGAFATVEDVLLQALLSPSKETSAECDRTGAELLAAMQSSPYREIELEPARSRPQVRGAEL
jgi:hypothetical protein